MAINAKDITTGPLASGHKIYSIGAEKINFDGFSFDKNFVNNNLLATLMLIICIDPTEKQKELMNKIGVVFEDDNGKKVFPREVEIEIDESETVGESKT